MLAIIRMAHTLKLGVVAEGVETAAQLYWLRSHDCDEIQGYLFSRPLPAVEIEAMLIRQNAEADRASVHTARAAVQIRH